MYDHGGDHARKRRKEDHTPYAKYVPTYCPTGPPGYTHRPWCNGTCNGECCPQPGQSAYPPPPTPPPPAAHQHDPYGTPPPPQPGTMLLGHHYYPPHLEHYRGAYPPGPGVHTNSHYNAGPCHTAPTGHPGNPTTYEELCKTVKTNQRSSQAWKEEWARYCTVNGEGLKDPARHSLKFLQEAIDRVNAVMEQCASSQEQRGKSAERDKKVARKPGDWECPKCQNVNFSWRTSCHRTTCTMLKPVDEVDDHVRQVEKVKTFQRKSAESKEAWESYCDKHGDGVRDPSKHTLEFLTDATAQLTPDAAPTTEA